MEQALNLPEDPEDLRRLVLTLTRENRQLKAQQDTLQEYIRLLLHKRFGAQSEAYRGGQSDLFNEAEATTEDGGDSESSTSLDAGPVGIIGECFCTGNPFGQARSQSLTPRTAPYRHYP